MPHKHNTRLQRSAQTLSGRLGRTVCALLFVLAPAIARAAEASQLHAQFMHLSSGELLDLAYRSGGGDYRPNDTVMICYSIVSNRFSQSQSAEEKEHSLTACLNLFSMYFYVYYDYTKCFENLNRAKEIAQSIGRRDPRIPLRFGAMYQTIGEEAHNRELDAKAMHYFCEAFNTAWEQKNQTVMDMAFTNLIYIAANIDSLQQVEPICTKYRKILGPSVLRQYNICLYEALQALTQGDRQRAMACYDRTEQFVPQKPEYDRLAYFTYINKARLYLELQQPDSALSCARRAEHIAVDREQKDLKLEVFSVLSEVYQKLGNDPLYRDYRERYYLMRDTLLNYQQLACVNEMEFQNELKLMNEEMASLEHKRDIQSVVTLIVAVVAVVVFALLFVIYRQNRHLRQSNAQLYRQTVEMLAADEEQRQLRRQMADSQAPSDSEHETVKYKNSSLDETDKNELLERIRTVMENVDETCQAGFSIERLALLVDSKYKYVSQVIHEKHGCNFNNLLNEYRIKEACKRMNDLQTYGNYTIEAISTSVGFRSRSTFVASFKRFTGLTPSEYQSMAREAVTARR